jgi:hypothetical protein
MTLHEVSETSCKVIVPGGARDVVGPSSRRRRTPVAEVVGSRITSL